MHATPFSGRTALLTTIASAVLLSGLSAPAFAQDSADRQTQADDEIIVTGSRIPRSEFESLQPVTQVNSEALEARAAINIADVLNEQSVFATVGGSSPIGEQGGASVGQNYANIFGLGPQRTLTLVNGKRFPAGISPSSGSGGVQVDLNTIPAALVDRIETIAIGGAPIYGTDAIAGTVNVLLKKDFEGLEVFGSYGISPEYDDSEEKRIGAVVGSDFHGGRGNLAVSVEYNDTKGLKRTDRPVTANGLSISGEDLLVNSTVVVDSPTGGPLLFADPFCFNTICFGPGSAAAAGLGNFFGRPNGIPSNLSNPDGTFVQFDSEGNLVPFVPGSGTGLIFRSGGDGLNVNDLAALSSDLERINANIFMNYELSDTMRMNGEFWYARSEATELIQQPEYNSPAFGTAANSWLNVGQGSVPILLSNPFLPTATRDYIRDALNIFHDADGDGIADPTIDTNGDGIPDEVGFARFGGLSGLVGDRPEGAKRQMFRGNFGLEGDAVIGDRDYVWDLNLSYGRTKSTDLGIDINQPNFNLAVRVIDDGSGTPVCEDPRGGCVPLNVVGTPTQEAIDYVTVNYRDNIDIEQFVFSGNLAGEFFDMPAGPVGGAIGFTFRRESASFSPDIARVQGLTRNTATPLAGRFNTKEIYGEVVVPLLADTGFLQALDFEGAARYVDNSVSGGDLTYTAGARAKMNDALEFRGNYTQSIRSPSITELFTPRTSTFSGAQDPCDGRFQGNGNFPDRRAANCLSQGMGPGFQSVVSNAAQGGFIAGNPNLDVETAKSYTFGFIARPTHFLEGLTFSVDWMDISIEDAIRSLSLTDVLEGCYDSADFPNDPLCSSFSRNSQNQIVDFLTDFRNIDSIEFAGLQAVASYPFDLGKWGELRLAGNYLYTDKNVITRGANDPDDIAGQVGNNKHKINLSATYTKDKWRWFNQARYLSNGDISNDNDFNIGGWGVWDTALSYDIRENVTFQVNVNNVLDRSGPYLSGLRSNATVTTYYPGIRGRYVTVSARARF